MVTEKSGVLLERTLLVSRSSMAYRFSMPMTQFLETCLTMPRQVILEPIPPASCNLADDKHAAEEDTLAQSASTEVHDLRMCRSTQRLAGQSSSRPWMASMALSLLME